MTERPARSPKQIASQKKAAEIHKQHGTRKASAATGIVQPGEVFSQQAFIERMGTTRSGLCEMRRRGLKARRDGGRIRILADDYLEYLRTQPVAALDEGELDDDRDELNENEDRSVPITHTTWMGSPAKLTDVLGGILNELRSITTLLNRLVDKRRSN